MNALHIAGPIILAAAAIAGAQVPVTEEPRHRVVFENAALRILNVNIPPGDTSLDHRHDRDIVTISMTSGTDTRTQAPGEPWSAIRPPRRLGDAKPTEYSGAPGIHRVENVGKTAYHLFAIENLRPSGWSMSPAASGLATTVTAESRAFRVYDVRLDLKQSQTSHTHTAPAIVVLMEGSAISEGSDAQAKAHAPAPVGLKHLDRPGQWVLVPAGEPHHVVRLGSGNAHLVEVEVR